MTQTADAELKGDICIGLMQDVVVGKPRDGDDRVVWLLDHQRFDKALSVLETDKGLKKSTHAQVPIPIQPQHLTSVSTAFILSMLQVGHS